MEICTFEGAVGKTLTSWLRLLAAYAEASVAVVSTNAPTVWKPFTPAAFDALPTAFVRLRVLVPSPPSIDVFELKVVPSMRTVSLPAPPITVSSPVVPGVMIRESAPALPMIEV